MGACWSPVATSSPIPPPTSAGGWWGASSRSAKSEPSRFTPAALARVPAIRGHVTNPITATVLVHHDPRRVSRRLLLEILDRALIDPTPAVPRTPVLDQEPAHAMSDAEPGFAGRALRWSRQEVA